MVELQIEKKNEVYLRIKAEPHVYQELSDHFTFEVPGAKFMPQYRSKYWDGKIRLFSTHTGEIYVGLLDKIISFCKNYNYDYKFLDNKFFGTPFEVNEMISFDGVRDYMKSITSHEPREYQVEGVYDALRHNRRLLISPTASGKSLMIYSIARYYTSHNKNILVIVPTTSLVEQMYKDFEEYGWESETYCHKIYSGREKETDAPVTITTWQSIYKLDRKYFEKFDVVIGDEAHLFKSKSLVQIMTKLHTAKYRFGFTGTLDGSQTHKWVLEGLFGPAYKVTRTAELMEKGHLSRLDITCLVLKHNPQKFDSYEDEIQYLISHERRNKFIKNLALDLKGNTLVLYSRVASHGEVLYDLINTNKSQDRKVFFIHGGVAADEREHVRAITESQENAIIVASYGTFSTGINIKRLHNVIFASPSKSRVRNLQSIGRVLRKGKDKVKAMLFDIADDCTYQSRKNYTLNHLIERIKTYNEEQFNYEIVSINLKK
jgi:superfamily II DNA or RNA helicase|tara:strand:- start:2090 stop:3553 length:1464 start_codon:yes stop_codon:yes gene_type:complete